jgi:hypothetical protein
MPSTPPPSPSTSRDAARHLERSHRIMGSPENRRIPADPSLTHSFGVQPANLSTRLSLIPPPPPQHDGPQASTSAFTLAPPPIITSMAVPALSSHRETLSSAQLAAAYAALPSFNPPRRGRPMGPPSNITPQQTFTHPLNHQFRFIEHVSSDSSSLNGFYLLNYKHRPFLLLLFLALPMHLHLPFLDLPLPLPLDSLLDPPLDLPLPLDPPLDPPLDLPLDLDPLLDPPLDLPLDLPLLFFTLSLLLHPDLHL